MLADKSIGKWSWTAKEREKSGNDKEQRAGKVRDMIESKEREKSRNDRELRAGNNREMVSDG